MTDTTPTQTPDQPTELRWVIPSRFRDADDLLVIRVEQSGTGRARVVVGSGDLDPIWADERAEQTAATLREIADALDPKGATP